MKFLLPAVTTLACLAQSTQAATWYFLRYYSASGQKFTGLTGEMVVPKLPKAGTYYLYVLEAPLHPKPKH